MRLIQGILNGDMKAAARLISMIEDGLPEARETMKALYPHTGRAYVVGITGPSGVGKSSLINHMISILKELNQTIGVIAVDPISPLTGGAILGDRIRMEQSHGTRNVFIRSMAKKGYLGGLSQVTNEAINVMDALGREIILVETVGVGQDEVDIASIVHTLIVMLAPGQGDEIQAMKAGILETADIFVINKADMEGAGNTVMDLQIILDIGKGFQEKTSWKPPIFRTQAIHNIGISELVDGIYNHRAFLTSRGLMQKIRERRIKSEILNIAKSQIIDSVMRRIDLLGGLDGILQEMNRKKLDPYSMVEQIFQGNND
jgi:LAO/AO transport system kinase